MNLFDFAKISRLKTTHTGRVLLNTGWASASAPINIGLGIIQTAILARMIGPEGIGTIALFGAVCALSSSLFQSGSSETVMTYTAKAESEGDCATLTQIVRHCYFLDASTSLVAFTALVLASSFTPRLLNLPPDTRGLQILFGLTILFQSTYWTSHSILRTLEKFSWTFYQSCLHSLIKVLAIAGIYLAGKGLAEVVWLLVGLSLINGLTLAVMALLALRRKGIHLNESTAPWWRVSREVWRFQLLCHARQIAKSINRYADVLLIGHLTGTQEVGFYRAGKQICEQIMTPAQGFLVSLFPEYSRLFFRGELDRLRKMATRFSVLLGGFALLIAALLFWGAKYIVLIILGVDFLPAVALIHILIISTIIQLAMYPLYSLPSAIGKPAPALAAAVTAVIVQILLMVYLIPRYGALGAAWAYVAYVATWAMVMLPSVMHILRKRSHSVCSGLA